MEIRARAPDPALHKQRGLSEPVADPVPRNESRIPGQRTPVIPGTAGCTHSGRPPGELPPDEMEYESSAEPIMYPNASPAQSLGRLHRT